MPFKKGDPNINRDGRPPKGKSFTDVLNRLLDEEIASQDGMTKKEALMRKLMQAGFEGQSWALTAIMDRVDGKPTMTIDQHNTNLNIDTPVHKFTDDE